MPENYDTLTFAVVALVLPFAFSPLSPLSLPVVVDCFLFSFTLCVAPSFTTNMIDFRTKKSRPSALKRPK